MLYLVSYIYVRICFQTSSAGQKKFIGVYIGLQFTQIKKPICLKGLMQLNNYNVYKI